MRDIRMRRAMWRELETWPWWYGEPNGSSKEPAWKPFTSRARASSRPYRAEVLTARRRALHTAERSRVCAPLLGAGYH